MIFKRPLPVLYVKIADGVDANRCTDAGRNPLLSPADMFVLGAAALIFFGPERLPKVARKVGQAVREVQNTSQSFIREMERAADEVEIRETAAKAAPVSEKLAEPRPALEPEPATEAPPV
jgi:sec-independent protein translocase protein TatB